ncbi:MAG: FmdE family protein [Desulfobacterales bacterium]|nr:FmdE family protein [Desulfobacterales bacterium]MDD4071872.1 FmdE family protein [Desulfobacterales bacterium]MDD4391533.1 FmdE family protein [Desulfobacterales bacterium]
MSEEYDNNVLEHQRIGAYSFEEFLKLAESFHGYAAPGIILGGFMVDLAMKHLPEGDFFDAICETSACLPDAIQLLTPCTYGNGWLRLVDSSRYALSMYEKQSGEGVRVSLDLSLLRAWPEFNCWFFKLKPKKEQDSKRLLNEIKEAGYGVCRLQRINIHPDMLKQKSRGQVNVCPLCGEGFRSHHAAICPACLGDGYFSLSEQQAEGADLQPLKLKARPVELAVGGTALHDMTKIVPGKLKGALFKEGQNITIGDVCRLQTMGKQHVYLQEENQIGPDWVHEDEAAISFAETMKGSGVIACGRPHEGKMDLEAESDGLLVVESEHLNRFNQVPEVMCASLKSHTLVYKGQKIAGTRAIPLYMRKTNFIRAMDILGQTPLFQIRPLKKASVGVLLTGNEVFNGLVEDQFLPIISKKVNRFDCEVVCSETVADDRSMITEAIGRLIQAGADMIVATAGMSVDPDDVTRAGIMDAGATDLIYGAPILPGTMIMLARIGAVQVVGVPACALYFNVTSFDLLLPRLLAEIPITRQDLAQMGHGGFCMQCRQCVFPRCALGR